jgi:hypothetical protein
MIGKLYNYRFELFFFSMLAILFGALVIPNALFENILMPVLLLFNMAIGMLLISKKKRFILVFIVLFAGALFVFMYGIIMGRENEELSFLRMFIYFIFYAVVTLEIIRQIWHASVVNKNVIIGLMSGYIALGLLSFFMFLAVENANPGSFEGLSAGTGIVEIVDSLLYYSYITLLTIGYGEITPITSLARKAAVLTGLIGQFYLVIITAIVVGKFISQSSKNRY